MAIRKIGASITFEQLAKNQEAQIRNSLAKVSNTILSRIRDEIRKGTKRSASTKNLQDAWTITKPIISKEGNRTTFSIGIGDLKILNSRAKYWFVINYGKASGGDKNVQITGQGGRKFIPPPKLGFFRGSKPPIIDGFGLQERWRDNSKGFLITPKKSIKPRLYIQKTKKWLDGYWSAFWDKELSKLKT